MKIAKHHAKLIMLNNTAYGWQAGAAQAP